MEMALHRKGVYVVLMISAVGKALEVYQLNYLDSYFLLFTSNWCRLKCVCPQRMCQAHVCLQVGCQNPRYLQVKQRQAGS